MGAGEGKEPRRSSDLQIFSSLDDDDVFGKLLLDVDLVRGRSVLLLVDELDRSLLRDLRQDHPDLGVYSSEVCSLRSLKKIDLAVGPHLPRASRDPRDENDRNDLNWNGNGERSKVEDRALLEEVLRNREQRESGRRAELDYEPGDECGQVEGSGEPSGSVSGDDDARCERSGAGLLAGAATAGAHATLGWLEGRESELSDRLVMVVVEAVAGSNLL